MSVFLLVLGIILAGLVALGTWDLVQTRHAILRNFPVVGHLRFAIERIGPELRQYIVAGNEEERPFNRNQRRWIYSSAKRENTTFGFGTDQHYHESGGYLLIKQAGFTHRLGAPRGDARLPCAKVLGEARGRPRAFRPSSAIMVSGMSFGSLSGAAIRALNAGCARAGCLHNTGEGGISPHHLQGGDLVFQIGTGYYGARDAEGRFSMDRLAEACAANPVKAVEIKISQGAKPGVGGVLPAAKVTEEIAQARGIPVGQTCYSPARHSAFGDVDGLVDFCESIAARTGLPVGIKSAVGDLSFWTSLAATMRRRREGPDFVTVDGGEGGTGAAPLVFADRVGLPFFIAQARVHAAFVNEGVADDVVFVGSGKLGLPENALLAFALGVDLVAVGREAMLAVGCIQAQKCHTDRCPTGVATQSRRLQRGLDVGDKSERAASYLTAIRREVLALARVCGKAHPALVTTDYFEILDGNLALDVSEVYDYQPEWGLPGPETTARVKQLMLAP